MRSGVMLAGVALVTASIGAAGAAAPKTATPTFSAPTSAQVAAVKKQRSIIVTLQTNKGAIGLQLDGAAAPKTVANFVNLVKGGFYNGMPVHRVEPGFVMQAGDPELKKLPALGYTIPDERSPLRHSPGVIAMARSYAGGEMVPNSASSQFYITLGSAPHLDQIGFTVFGRVTSGMDVVMRIRVGDRITKATLGAAAKRPAVRK